MTAAAVANPVEPDPGKIEYKWRSGAHLGGDPRMVGVAIMEIAKIKGVDFYAVTGSMMLSHARDPSSPLHRYCDWDDKAAADAHRRAQLRNVISSIYYAVIDNSKTKIFRPLWVPVPKGKLPDGVSGHIEGSRPAEKPYVRSIDTVHIKDAHQHSLDECAMMMRSYRARFEKLSTTSRSMKNAFRLLDAFIDAVEKERDAAAKAAAKQAANAGERKKPKGPSDQPRA